MIFDEPMFARFIRIQPTETYSVYNTMKFELYGCFLAKDDRNRKFELYDCILARDDRNRKFELYDCFLAMGVDKKFTKTEQTS